MQVDERRKERNKTEPIDLINGRQTTVKKKFLNNLQVTLNSEAAWGETMRLVHLLKYHKQCLLF